jgi:hypothetical protein
VRKYLQANPLFSLFLLSTLPEEPFAGHEAGPVKRRKKRLLKPPVHLYRLFSIFSLISSTFSFGVEVQNAVAA